LGYVRVQTEWIAIFGDLFTAFLALMMDCAGYLPSSLIGQFLADAPNQEYLST
jgi:hypothetical protein